MLEAGGPLLGREEVHLLKTLGDVMKTSIKVMKRDDSRVTGDTKISSARKNQERVTEVIVKSWVVESRERHRARSEALRLEPRREI